MARQARAVAPDRRAGEGVAWGGQGLALAMLCTLLFLTFLDKTHACANNTLPRVDLREHNEDPQ